MQTDLVKQQYERFPYPETSIIAGVQTTSVAHASFEAGASLIFRQGISHAGKTIGLLGCGTFEPYAFAATHPQAQILAVDVSARALARAKQKCRLFLKKNVRFLAEDFTSDSTQIPRGSLDYAHCYGVLHHLKNPHTGFKTLAALLKPNGFARIMVYNQSARHFTSLLQDACRLLGLTPQDAKAPQTLKKWIASLPVTHPLRLTYELNTDHLTSSGRVDAFLHACENTFTVESLLSTLNDAGLYLHGWDFSQNSQNLLKDALGKSVIEKLKFLEAFHQWPASFTFWVSKRQRIQKSKEVMVMLNPLVPANRLLFLATLGPFKKSIYSTLLRKTVELGEDHHFILKKLLDGPLPQEKLSAGLKLRRHENIRLALGELVGARFCLEV